MPKKTSQSQTAGNFSLQGALAQGIRLGNKTVQGHQDLGWIQ